MSFLQQAAKPQLQAPIITIVGSPGAGKTSLGGVFPRSIFIQAESCAATFETWDEDAQPLLLPVLPKAQREQGISGKLKTSTHDTLMAQLRELATVEHPYTTVVLDSITSLSAMLEHELCEKYAVSTVADAAGGFHKGYLELAQMHAELINACDVLRKRRGMAVVFLAHTGIEKIKNSPEETSEYSVWGLNMHPKSAALYVANCDAVLYLTKERYITGGATNHKGQTTKYGRALETGARTLVTSGDGKAGYIAAKNRYGMPPELPCPLGTNPILQFLKFFNQSKGV